MRDNMLAVIPWFFFVCAVALMTVANVMPWDEIQKYHGFFSRSIITCLVAGWLSDVWRHKDRIRRRITLMVLLGYYVWMTVTDNIIEMSPKSAACETAGFLCLMVGVLARYPKAAREKRAK